MATTSIPHRWKYDAFVSFRGEDIRKNFMDHMFNDFKHKGIHVFRDDRELPKGEEISPQLYKAIEESRFLIVIFSKNYASSTWCLRELVKILECKQIEDPKHEVRIIFYDAKPDVVRKQKRSYSKAFAKHDVSNRTEVDEWREALSMAANLSGWDLQDMTNGYEYKFIDSISREILKKLCDGPLHVGENLAGINFHFNKLNLSHFVGSDKVNMIGICGISGIGKTTLAKAVYNSMHTHFDGSCFCDNVQGVEKQQGLTQVQMQMIGKILKTDDLKISSVGEGSMVIKQRLACKRILLVLDDVNNVEQLEALAGSRDWFYPGSLIIFTGKDKQLLRSHKVDELYEMESLDDYEALELFSLNAFGERHPTKDFEEFASQIVKYLHGHPLALKVIGRSLYEKSVDFWKSELERLQTYPNSEIVQKLRPSFDSLASDQKRMFLDIAFAFIGENKDFAASVLHSSHCSANAIIEVLADKFLIIVYEDCLQMHELIQSMAREITREEFDMPGKQRRLCISSALSEKKVAMTEAIEVLVLLLRKSSQEVHINTNSFALMKNLRILKIYAKEEFDQKVELKGCNVKYSGNLYFLSNELSLFCWHGCPLKYLPSDFYPENIVVIDLSYSNIKQLWTTPKCLRRLKVMKLRYCCNLTTTPDFSEITSLEELDLEGCVNLVTVHPSVGMLKRLVVLNMRDCRRARSFPNKVEMDSLQVLNLSGCLKVDKLSEDLGKIKTLIELHIDRTAITELPSFIPSLINLESLSLGGQGKIQPRWWTSITAPFGLLSKQQHPQRPVSLAGLHMLKRLNLSYCNLVQVPESIGGLSCLKELDLEGNNFTSFPGSLSQLSSLNLLNVNGCKKLEVLPELPHSLECISASDCTSLREVTGSSKGPSRHRGSYFFNCPKLFKNVTIGSEGSISKTRCLDSSITSQGSIHQLSAFLGYLGFSINRCEFFTQDTSLNQLNIAYHGNSNIPEWFTNRSMGNHVKVELPSDWCYDKFRGFGTCLVFKCKKPHKFEGYSVKNFDGDSLNPYGYIPVSIKDYFEKEVIGIQDSYMIWLHYKKSTWRWEEAKNFVTFSFEENNEEDVEVKECGVRLICDGDIEQEADLSMLQGLPTPTQHGGMLGLTGASHQLHWSW
ncbi:NB-ARC domains-containing protein [Artemisia annua]|uniref:ADP-ribosyl cyclase/cyclic ADP-ribose hydrolase n=1 Tax=Artemisia annua TaxID=35608 RepID=A0A2U1NS53_ARTAN|nr:NB-ARC domains-containing protein [Artemisia annua]